MLPSLPDLQEGMQTNLMRHGTLGSARLTNSFTRGKSDQLLIRHCLLGWSQSPGKRMQVDYGPYPIQGKYHDLTGVIMQHPFQQMSQWVSADACIVCICMQTYAWLVSCCQPVTGYCELLTVQVY